MGDAPDLQLRRIARKRRAERGVALVIVLASLAICAAMLTEFQDETSADFGHALAERDAVKAEYAAISAINLTRLLIAAEPTIRKNLAILRVPQIPVWDYAGQVLGAFNDSHGMSQFKSLGAFDLGDAKALGLEGAGFDLVIVDEDSKLNFNQAARPSAFAKQRLVQQLSAMMAGIQYDPLFDEEDADGNRNSRQQICAGIVDWTDTDQEGEPCDPTGQVVTAGGEDSFYQLLDEPYERKNAGFDSLDELHLVRGITDEFWTTFIQPDPADPSSRLATVWGPSQVNINTVDPLNLLTLICTYAVREETPLCYDLEQQLTFLSLTRMIRSMTAGIPLFRSPNALLNALKGKGEMLGPLLENFGLQPVKWASESEFKKVLSTSSKVFSIYATGVVTSGTRRTTRRVHAVVDFRGAPQPPDLSNFDPSQQNASPDTGQTQTPLGAAVSQAIPANLPSGATADSLVAAFRPSPGGRIVYYRID